MDSQQYGDVTTSAAKAESYFTHLPQYCAAVCKTCHFAVFPDHAYSHLSSRHPGLNTKERRQIVDDLQSWPDLSLSSDESFTIPNTVEMPIAGLELFNDGLRCILEPERCSYVCRSQGTLRRHWYSVHSWSVGGNKRRGLRTARNVEIMRQRMEEACVTVDCQRLFISCLLYTSPSPRDS